MTRKIERQPIWESSVRPLYPKCIWVKTPINSAGYRHFIFDHDISTYHKEIYSSIDADTTTRRNRMFQRSQSCDQIEDDLMSLKLIGSADVVHSAKRSDPFMHANRNNFTNHRNSLTLIKKQANPRVLDIKANSDDGKISEENHTETVNEANQNNPLKSHVDKEKYAIIDGNKNQLTERVLQWLDLAGRNTIIRSDGDPQKTSNCLKRRSLTAMESHKVKPFLSNLTSSNNLPLPTKRSDSIHHLSLKFNEDDTYLAQIKNSSDSLYPNEKLPLSFSEFFPTTYRCSRKFLSLRNTRNKSLDGCKTSPGSTNLLNSSRSTSETRQNEVPSAHRKLSKSHLKKNETIEGQYRSMIQRQILENSCNTQLAKRQLHIFMPNLPKRTNQGTDKGLGNNDCDSCISLSSSRLSK